MEGAEDSERVKFQLAEFLATGSGDAQSLSDQVERFARQAKANHYDEDRAQYQAWLEEAQAGSMRPLFRTVKSHEATTSLGCGPSFGLSSGRKFGGRQTVPSRG